MNWDRWSRQAHFRVRGLLTCVRSSLKNPAIRFGPSRPLGSTGSLRPISCVSRVRSRRRRFAVVAIPFGIQAVHTAAKYKHDIIHMALLWQCFTQTGNVYVYVHHGLPGNDAHMCTSTGRIHWKLGKRSEATSTIQHASLLCNFIAARWAFETACYRSL